MANRVIRDRIWNSRSLAKLSREANAWYPHWVLMADDWGCFDADPRVIRGKVYPLRSDTPELVIEGWLVEYHNSGHVFLWTDGSETLWGYFTSFDRNNPYFNKTQVDTYGRQEKHRRRTPEPPEPALSVYLKEPKRITVIQDILGQVRTSQDVYRNPNLNPNPVPNPIKLGRQKAPTPPAYTETQKRVYDFWLEEMGSPLNWIAADGMLLSTLLKRQKPELIVLGWKYYIKNPDDYCRKNGQSWRNYVASFEKVVSRMGKAGYAKGVESAA